MNDFLMTQKVQISKQYGSSKLEQWLVIFYVLQQHFFIAHTFDIRTMRKWILTNNTHELKNRITHDLYIFKILCWSNILYMYVHVCSRCNFSTIRRLVWYMLIIGRFGVLIKKLMCVMLLSLSLSTRRPCKSYDLAFTSPSPSL